MKTITIATLLSLAVLCSCHHRNGNVAKLEGIEIDSVKADTIVPLVDGDGSPHMKIALQLKYVKGRHATAINNALLHAGLLLPDYLSLGGETFTMEQAADSFLRRISQEYKVEYAPLYLQDKGNAHSYNYIYKVQTETCSEQKDVLTYIAHVYMEAGGAHGIHQTICRNFNATTGKPIALDNLFMHGHADKLTELITKAVARKFDVETLEQLQALSIFADGKVYVPDNFILANDHITFIYGEDEVAPHAVGEIRIDIDRDDIRGLLKPNE